MEVVVGRKHDRVRGGLQQRQEADAPAVHRHGDRAVLQVVILRLDRPRRVTDPGVVQGIVVVRMQAGSDRAARIHVADDLREGLRAEVDVRRGVDVAVDQVDAALSEGRRAAHHDVDRVAVVVLIRIVRSRGVRVRHADRRAARIIVAREQRHHALALRDVGGLGDVGGVFQGRHVRTQPVDDQPARAEVQHAADLDLPGVVRLVVKAVVQLVSAVGHSQGQVRVHAGDRPGQVQLRARLGGREGRAVVSRAGPVVVEVRRDRGVRGERDRPGEPVDALHAIDRRRGDAVGHPEVGAADGQLLRDVQVEGADAIMVPWLPQVRRDRRLQQELGADGDRGGAADRDVPEGSGMADVQLGARDRRVDRDRGHARVGAVEVHVARVDRQGAAEGVRAGESPGTSAVLSDRS